MKRKEIDRLLDQRDRIKSEVKSRLESCGVDVIFVMIEYDKADGADPSSFSAYYQGAVTLEILDNVSRVFGTRKIEIDCEMCQSDNDDSHEKVLRLS